MMRCTPIGFALLLWSATAAAQSASIHGVVWDSVASKPLAGATVQLAGNSAAGLTRSTRSDSTGRFAFDALPGGQYTIGFLHPALDSLGLEPPVRSVTVGDGPQQVELAVPSLRRIRDAVCGAQSATAGPGLVIGFVRDARDGSPLGNVIVRGDWIEYTLEKNAVTRRQPMVLDTTTALGGFALCGVPGRGLLLVRTSRSDSAGSVEVEIPASGFARRDVYVGGAGAPNVRLAGRVLAGATLQPLADVQVRVAASGTRTNADGAWVLDAPAGTRMLDIRALGYYPVRRPIDVVPDAAPVRTELFTMKAMLDTVRVTASRLTANMQEFEQRHRSSGSGAFLTHDAIRRLNPATTAAIFRTVPGMEVFGGSVRGSILMKGAFYDANTADLCKPELFVDGMYVPTADDTLRAIDIDALTAPEDIAGIEVYREPFVPPQFRHDRGNMQTGIGACGAIVVWRMPPAVPEFRESRKRRMLKAGALAGTAVALFIGIQHVVR